MNPYPGLRHFRETDQDFFYGREEEIDELVARLADRRMLAVLGVSGCGKSSLIHAGLIPVLRSGLAEPLDGNWRICSLAPGGSPLDALDRAVGTQLERRTHALQSWAKAQTAGDKILIFVDQFEEIFPYYHSTLASDGGNSAALFVDLLVTAASDPGVPIYLILTMRTDYLGECALFRGLSEALNDASYLVPRLTRLRQQDAIERPADSMGVIVQSGLVQRLLNDSEGDPDKLPVLQHLLKRIWELRVDGPLDLPLYEKAGGWDHALERDAEDILAKFPQEREGIRRMFQWLSEPGAGEKPVRRRRPASELPEVTGLSADRLGEIVPAFAERGFLRCEEGPNALVDFTHESVMWQWPLLRKWIQEESEDASRIRFMHESARKKQLLTGVTLEEAQAVRNRSAISPIWARRYVTGSADLQLILEWISESERRQNDELGALRRSRRWLAIGLAGALVAVVLIAWLGWRSYRDQKTSEQRLAGTYWAESRYAQEKANDLVALHFAAEAIRLDPQNLRSILLDVRALWPQNAVRALFEHEAPVLGAKLTRDESRLLTWSAGDARLWDARTGEAIGPALHHQGNVNGALFSRDESRILTWSYDKTARLWDARTGQMIGPPLQHEQPVLGARFNRDESRILTWTGDLLGSGEVRLWDVRTGQAIGPRLHHSRPVNGAQFSQDETRILTWSTDESARLWDARTGQEIVPALKHDGPVMGAQFSRDESRILTWGIDRRARVWDARTGKAVLPPLQHQALVGGTRFSRDETRILTWSDDHTARLWDAQTGKAIGPAMEHGSWVRGAQFSRDESRILTWSGQYGTGEARLWNTSSGQEVVPAMEHRGPLNGATFSLDETRVLTWSDDGTARLWDARTGQPVGPPLQQLGPVNGAQFSRDEKGILTWSADGRARLWNALTGEESGPTLHGSDDGAQFSPDETRILTWGGFSVGLWDARSGQAIAPALQHKSLVAGARFSPDGRRVLTWSGYGGNGEVRLWDAGTGQAIMPAPQHWSSIRGAQFSRNGNRILTWRNDKLAHLWDARTGQAIGPALQHPSLLNGAHFSPDESRILTWSEDKTAHLWDAATGHAIGTALQHHDVINGAQFSPDDSRILTWSADNAAHLWDARTGRAIGPALQHLAPVNGALFSAQQHRALTWGSDGTVRLWDARTGQAVGRALQHKDPVKGAQFSRDESRILTWSGDSGNGEARLWDARTGQPIGPALQHNGPVNSAQFSRDENFILTGSADARARFWDARTGQALGPVLLHGNAVRGAQLSRDESRVLTWSSDGTARVWILPIDMDFPAEHVRLALQTLTATDFDFVTRQVRILSPAEWQLTRNRYEQIAAEHAKTCKYREFNEWLQRQPKK